MGGTFDYCLLNKVNPCQFFVKYLVKLRILQCSTLTFKVTCPIGQVRLEVRLSCIKCLLSHILRSPLHKLPEYSPVPSDKCHSNTCPRSDFQNFYLSRTGRQPLTHWGRDEMNNISQTTFQTYFLQWKLVLPIDIENPYRLSNCLYRYISIYIGFLATNF